MVDIAALVAKAMSAGDPTAWFDELYEAAEGNARNVPWAGLAPHPALTSWLDQVDLDGVDAIVV
ncbi:MAG: hypothetical protein ACI867_001250, partial [Glaciecola sp.]